MSQNDGLVEEKLADSEPDSECASEDFVAKIMNKCSIYQQNRSENKAKIASLQAEIMCDFGEPTMQEYIAMKQEHQGTVSGQDARNDGQKEGK